MQRLELNTDDESLREILSNGKKYFVPKFQRDYSWEREQWEVLWEDITALLDESETYHYMGYLVIQPPSKENHEGRSKIIDGQQRLTTFSLMILATVKRLKEIEGEEERQKNLLNNFIGSEDLVYLKRENKIELNRNNNYYYKEAVGGNDLPQRGKPITVRLMGQAIDYFYNLLKRYDTGEAIGKLIDKISSKLLFTTIYISDELNAYKVFETLNARGVQLSSGDLLKNYIFSLIDRNNDTPDDILDDLEEQWEKIGVNIGDNNYSSYILAEWNSRNKLVRKTNLYRNIKNNITDNEQAKAYLNKLKTSSDLYAALLDYEHDFWKGHADYQQIKRNLAVLKLFSIVQPISVLLAIYNNMPKYFSTILDWIVNFSMRYNIICRDHRGDQERLYNKIVLLVQNNTSKNDIKNKLLELYPKDEKFRQDFTDKSLHTKQSHKKAKYILARIEEKMSNASIDETTLTLEHILPQNPTDEWINYFGENWKNFFERIGNMALVSVAENTNLAQRSFDEKKEVLSVTSYSINNISSYEKWDSNTVESRQAKLADIAVSVWRID